MWGPLLVAAAVFGVAGAAHAFGSTVTPIHTRTVAAQSMRVGTMSSAQLQSMRIRITAPTLAAQPVVSLSQAEASAVAQFPGIDTLSNVEGARYGFVSSVNQPSIDQNAWVVALTPAVGELGPGPNGGPITLKVVVINATTGAFVVAHMEGPPVPTPSSSPIVTAAPTAISAAANAAAIAKG